MAFCTPAQFLRGYDRRRVAELLSDSGTPVAPGDVLGSETLDQLLEEASEMVRAAVQIRQKYTTAELETTAASTTRGFLLRRLTADLAYGLLQMRRGVAAADVSRLAPGWIVAQQMLAQLRDGQMIFTVVDGSDNEVTSHQTSGLPAVSDDLSYPNNPLGFKPLSYRTNGRVFPGTCD